MTTPNNTPQNNQNNQTTQQPNNNQQRSNASAPERRIVVDELSQKHPDETKLEFNGLVIKLVSQMMSGRINGNDAKRQLSAWLFAAPTIDRDEIDRVVADLKGTVDTLTQELPRMLVR